SDGTQASLYVTAEGASEVSLIGTVSSPFELHDLRIGANRAGNQTYDTDLALVQVFDEALDTGHLADLLNELHFNHAPVAYDQMLSFGVGSAANISLSATDVDGGTLVFNVLDGPFRGTMSGSAPDFLYTPDTQFVGSDSFTFTASDGSLTSNTGTVTLVSAPQTASELWNYYDPAIRTDALNVEWNTNWVDGDITISQIRYDLGDLNGTQTNASPKIAAYYAYPTAGV
ncbi:Ig-like domain-containing protein, partial [Pontiellaceae bacterium B12227]|nr:Ig-like domain-containing protein [Pontiellaceae bacterium B12227]